MRSEKYFVLRIYRTGSHSIRRTFHKMAVSPYHLIWIVPLLAVVHADCGMFEEDCDPHCCSDSEHCAMYPNGTRFCGKYCADGIHVCRSQYRCCGQTNCCKETQSCCGLKHCCPSGYSCCTDIGEYCCPDGTNCYAGMCSYSSDTPSDNEGDEDTTSGSGSHWHYVGGVGGGAFIFIIIPVCWVRRRRRVALVRGTVVPMPLRPGQRGGEVRNANRTATTRNTQSQPSQVAVIGCSTHVVPVPVPGANPVQSGPAVEPPPYSEFVNDRDKNRLCDSKTVEDV